MKTTKIILLGLSLSIFSFAFTQEITPILPVLNGQVDTIANCSEEDSEYIIECTTMYVSENRKKEDSRQIDLPIKVFKTLNQNPEPPIFYLNGGPGASNLGFKPFTALLEKRDVVLVGYRGVDGSSRLDCEDMFKSKKGTDLFSEEALAFMSEKVKKCADKFIAQGFDLDGYNMVEVIDDMETARQLLGYDKVSLLSQSYGTRLAQIYALRYPESIHRSLMVAVNPPGHFVWLPETLDSQLEYYSELCKKDPYCSRQTEDLAATIDNVIHNMPKRWLVFPIDPDKIRMAAFMGLYHRDSAASVFDMFIAADKGDYSGLALVSIGFDLQMGSMEFAWGDSFAKSFPDFNPNVDYGNVMDASQSIMGSPGSQTFGLQNAWPGVQIDSYYNQPQYSKTESLLLGGTVDFSTPSRFATQELLPYLENGHQVVLPELGHSGDLIWRQRKGFIHLANNFYSTGKVDASKYKEEPMIFKAETSFPSMAKTGLAIIVGFLFVLTGIVYRIRKFLRKRRLKRVKIRATTQTQAHAIA